MPVAMMGVGGVRMAVGDRLVAVEMPMARPGCDRRIVGMLVVLVVDMSVLVLQGLVGVHVIVMLGEMQLDPQGHEQTGGDELPAQRLAQQQG